MATGAVQCLLPTIPGHRYELTYNLRGPCAVGWWNGSVDPLSQRALDLISGNNGAFLNGATNSHAWIRWPRASSSTARPSRRPRWIPTSGRKTLTIQPARSSWATRRSSSSPMPSPSRRGSCRWSPPTNPAAARSKSSSAATPSPSTAAAWATPIGWRWNPRPIRPAYDLHFHIADAHYGTVGADVLTTNAPILIGGGHQRGVVACRRGVRQALHQHDRGHERHEHCHLHHQPMRLYLNGVCVMPPTTPRSRPTRTSTRR